MSAGAVTLLDAQIAQTKAAQAPEWNDDDFFELFVAQNVVGSEAVTAGDIEDGVLGGGLDGGIDSLYIFVDGHLIKDDTKSSDFKRRPEFQLHLIQSKRETTFAEKAIDKFASSASNLFDLSNDIDEQKYVKLYQKVLREKIVKFRDLYIALASKNPKIRFPYYYVTRGDSDEINENVRIRVEEIENIVDSCFPEADFEFLFIGARDLLDLTRKRPSEELELTIVEHLTADPKGFIALARLDAYNRFMRNESGGRLGHLFDDNVRAYQNSVEVNKSIAYSLRNPDDVDFWHLNNGITILAENAVITGKKIKIVDPQIINGLQTSFEILNFFEERENHEDPRHIMVKVLPAASSASRDRVIKATNSQTSVSPASLRASDSIQRDIEESLGISGFYYDRRKNLYRNEGKPRDKIIGISELAQSVMAVLLQRPNDARARPSNLIKDEKDYNKVFNTNYDLGMYAAAAGLRKRVEKWFRSIDCDRADRNNILFYVLMRLAVILTKRTKPVSAALSRIDISTVSDAQIKSAFNDVWAIYEAAGGDAKAAKGRELTAKVFELGNGLSKKKSKVRKA